MSPLDWRLTLLELFVNTFLLVINIFTAVAMIALILVQHGKGADAGASFGGGGSATVFGAGGTANVLSKATAWLTVVFFASSLALVYINKKSTDPLKALEKQAQNQQVDVPQADPAALGPAPSDIPSAATTTDLPTPAPTAPTPSLPTN